MNCLDLPSLGLNLLLIPSINFSSMPSPNPFLNPKQMHPQRQNNHDNPQMEIAMQRMVEVHTEMMQVMTQYMVNCDSKELPPGMQQVMDDHSRIVQMMSQILAGTKNNLPQNDLGSKDPRSDAEITLQACKNCREIGHTSKGMS
jgi:hypothetical protein